jgi:hypothetical protein
MTTTAKRHVVGYAVEDPNGDEGDTLFFANRDDAFVHAAFLAKVLQRPVPVAVVRETSTYTIDPPEPLSYSVTVPVTVSVMLADGEFDVGQPLIEIDLSSLNADGDAAQGVYDEDNEEWSSSPDNADIADAARKKVAELLGLRQPEQVQADLAKLGDLTPPMLGTNARITNSNGQIIEIGDHVGWYHRASERRVRGFVRGFFTEAGVDGERVQMLDVFVPVVGSTVQAWADEVGIVSDPRGSMNEAP